MGIASIITLVLILIIGGFATLVIKKGAIGILYPLIPLFGYYYFLYSILCGIGKLFVPLEKFEKTFVKELRDKSFEKQLLKREEKDLKSGLALIDKNIFDTVSFEHLKQPIVVDDKSINGWQVATIIVAILLIVFFAVSFKYAPILTEIIN